MAKACCAASLPSLQLSSRSRDATDVTEMSHCTTQVVKGGPPKGPDDIFERARQAGAEDGAFQVGLQPETSSLPLPNRQSRSLNLNDVVTSALCPSARKQFFVIPRVRLLS